MSFSRQQANRVAAQTVQSEKRIQNRPARGFLPHHISSEASIFGVLTSSISDPPVLGSGFVEATFNKLFFGHVNNADLDGSEELNCLDVGLRPKRNLRAGQVVRLIDVDDEWIITGDGFPHILEGTFDGELTPGASCEFSADDGGEKVTVTFNARMKGKIKAGTFGAIGWAGGAWIPIVEACEVSGGSGSGDESEDDDEDDEEGDE